MFSLLIETLLSVAMLSLIVVRRVGWGEKWVMKRGARRVLLASKRMIAFSIIVMVIHVFFVRE